MNSKIIIAIVAVLVVLGVGGYFVAGNKSSKNTGSTQMVSEVKTKMMADGEGKPMSFKDLLTMGVAQKCTFNNTVDNVTSEGTVYTSGGKMRADMTSTMDGKPSVTHMMMESDTSHIWVDGQTQGYKITLDEKDIEEAEKEGKIMNMEMNRKYNYDCSPSVVSESMFELPAGIDFMDLTQMMPQAGETGTMKSEDMKKMQCGMCSNLTGANKTECLASLSCN